MWNNLFEPTWQWVKSDWHSNSFRFTVEVIAWLMSIGCSVTMAFTVPHPPLMIIYPVWIMGCSMYAWAAWTRRSFGMLANYLLLSAIDTIGLIRLTTN